MRWGKLRSGTQKADVNAGIGSKPGLSLAADWGGA